MKYRTSIFLLIIVKTINFPGGSMEKMIGRCIPNIYFISQRLAITEAEEISVLPI